MGSYVPSFTPYILAILCFIVALIQFIGYYGVYKVGTRFFGFAGMRCAAPSLTDVSTQEQLRTFRAYAWVNAVGFLCIFICSGVLIGVSAGRHNDAVKRCMVDYFGGSAKALEVSVSSEGEGMCSGFAWAQVGFMGGLWLILFIGQVYFMFMTKFYATEQKVDHQKYKSIYEANAEEFAMMERNSQWGPHLDAWDHRPSMDDPNVERDIHGNIITPGHLGSNMYEQPYASRPHPLSESQAFSSETSIKKVYDGSTPGESESAYDYVQAAPYAAAPHQGHQQGPPQYPNYDSRGYPIQPPQETGYESGYGHQPQGYASGRPGYA